MNVTKMFLQKMRRRSNFETVCLKVKNFLADLVDYKTWNTHSCLRQIPTKLNTRCWNSSSFIGCFWMDDLETQMAEFQENYVTMAIYIEMRK